MTLRAADAARDWLGAGALLAFLIAEACEDGRNVAFGDSLREIAGAIGLTPEAFYRTLAQLEAEGAIKRKAGHLAAHLETAAVFLAEQIAHYDRLCRCTDRHSRSWSHSKN